MRLAVTGGSGFVGRHLVAAAVAAGHEVVALARRDVAAQRLSSLGARVVEGDLGRPTLDALTEGADALVHLAHIGSEKRGASFDDVNVEGTRRAVAAAASRRLSRVVLLSGLGVAHYGMTPRCTNAYFQSKMSAELELFRSGAPGVVFRPSYIVGPGDGLLRGLLKSMSAGRVRVPGDGSYRMQPAAVADAADAILAAALGDVAFGDGRPPHRVVDLVGPEPVTYRAFITLVTDEADLAGRPFEYTLSSQALDAADAEAEAAQRRDDLDCLLCDEVAPPEPLEDLLGRPSTPLAEAVRTAVRGTLGLA